MYGLPLIIPALLLGVSVPAIASTAEADFSDKLDTLFVGNPYAKFEWTKAEGVSDRGAIVLPVHLDGIDGWFQLDTGLDVSLVYGNLPAERGWPTHDGAFQAPDLHIGEMALGPVWIRNRPDIEPKNDRLGSLGLDLLVGSFVVIDYPHQRFALLRPGAVPLWLWQQTIWTPATLRDAKLFPYLCLGDTTTPALFFDTGSSAFDLVMDREDWDGLRDPDATPSNVDGSSWGQEITIVGAPARGPLSIGSIRLDTPMVYYIAQSPTMFSSWPFPTDGLVGNSPFWDRVVILDLGIRPRFGILAAEQ